MENQPPAGRVDARSLVYGGIGPGGGGGDEREHHGEKRGRGGNRENDDNRLAMQVW